MLVPWVSPFLQLFFAWSKSRYKNKDKRWRKEKNQHLLPPFKIKQKETVKKSFIIVKVIKYKTTSSSNLKLLKQLTVIPQNLT